MYGVTKVQWFDGLKGEKSHELQKSEAVRQVKDTVSIGSSLSCQCHSFVNSQFGTIFAKFCGVRSFAIAPVGALTCNNRTAAIKICLRSCCRLRLVQRMAIKWEANKSVWKSVLFFLQTSLKREFAQIKLKLNACRT